MARGIGRAANKIAQILGCAAQSDGRTDTRMPYKNPVFQRLYSHKGFVPGIDGGLPNAATIKATKEVLVRVPVMPQLHASEPSNPVWRGGAVCANMFGLCIIHCAMRTGESCLKMLLLIASTRYVAAKGKDKEIINRYLNDAVYTDLYRLRPLITVNEKGQLNKVSLNGDEVRILWKDLTTGEGHLLRIVRNLYDQLGVSTDASQIDAWVTVLTHWGKAMRAAYTMRATPADRAEFRKESWMYVQTKSSIRAGITVWYDWQLYSAFGAIFDKYESLMLISQEGMEACQKWCNTLMRLGNNFANVGRIPWAILKAGRERVKAYMQDRAKKKKSPEEWLWRQMFKSFASRHSRPIERVDEYRRIDKTLDWETEFVPEWESCRAITKMYVILRAKVRFNLSFFAPGSRRNGARRV
jgi:hypothetical protein